MLRRRPTVDGESRGLLTLGVTADEPQGNGSLALGGSLLFEKGALRMNSVAMILGIDVSNTSLEISFKAEGMESV